MKKLRDFIIELLGGYTPDQYYEMFCDYAKIAKKYIELREKIHTKRDPKTGRFIKK